MLRTVLPHSPHAACAKSKVPLPAPPLSFRQFRRGQSRFPCSTVIQIEGRIPSQAWDHRNAADPSNHGVPDLVEVDSGDESPTKEQHVTHANFHHGFRLLGWRPGPSFSQREKGKPADARSEERRVGKE